MRNLSGDAGGIAFRGDFTVSGSNLPSAALEPGAMALVLVGVLPMTAVLLHRRRSR